MRTSFQRTAEAVGTVVITLFCTALAVGALGGLVVTIIHMTGA